MAKTGSIQTRRSFNQWIGAGAALTIGSALPVLGQTARGDGKTIGYAVVGLGRISLQHFMPATKDSQRSKVVALVSGHRDKALKYAAEYGVPEASIYSYEDYDKIADNKAIDAVYIGLPNSMHAEYSIRAANANKHVLCEKPMATSVRDAQAMVDASKAADRKLMIAYRCQYEPVNTHAIQLIRDGKIGKVQVIESANGFNIRKGEWRLNKKMAGGGPLMDMGVYSLNACRYLTGEEPEKLQGYATVVDQDGRFDEVEENLAWSMRFPSGAVASCTTTYGSNTGGYIRVHGSKGTISAEPAFAYEGIKMTVQVQGEPAMDDADRFKDPHQFTVLADEFSASIMENRETRSNGEEGLRDIKYVEQIYRSAGIKL